MFFGRGYAERFRKQVEAGVFAAPFAPLLHGVVDRGVAEAGKRNVARWFDLVDDRTLIDKAHVEVQNIVADEEIAIDGEFPEVFDDVGFFALQDFDRAADRWLDSVTKADNFCRRSGEA